MKRWCAALLAAVILFSFAACGGGTGTGTNKPSRDDSEQTYTFIDNLPAELNGKYVDQEIVVAVDSNYKYELYASEESDSTVDQLVYKRNQLIQQRFGCTISLDETTATGLEDISSHYTYIQDSLNRGECQFDLIMLMAYQTGKLVTSGYYLDWLEDTTYCKASIEGGAEWWPTNINKDSTIMGHQYLAVSDLCLTTMEMCYSVLFNKDLEGDNNVAKNEFNTETLYQAVDNGTWTLDHFYNIVKDFYRDSQTSGVQGTKDEADLYGLTLGRGTDSDAWAFALGFQYVTNNGVDMPEIWTVTTKVNSAIETLRNLTSNDYTYGAVWGDGYSKRTQFFVDGHALFDLSSLEQLKRDTFHEMESDYGVLPYPKYDTNQKQYLTGTMDHYTMLSIPLYSFNLELTDVVVEALSAESCNSVKDAYYESVLKYNSSRDPDSIRMIELIMAGRRYDLTTYHYAEFASSPSGGDGSSLGLFFRYLLSSDTKTDASTYWQTNMIVWNNSLDKVIDKYENMFNYG